MWGTGEIRVEIDEGGELLEHRGEGEDVSGFRPKYRRHRRLVLETRET